MSDRSVLLAHPGTQHAPKLARELNRTRLLGCFWTGIGFAESSPTARIIRGLPFLRALRNRIVPGVPAARICSRFGPEMRALWQLRHGAPAEAIFMQRNLCFQQAIPEQAIATSKVVVGFDTSSWLLGRRARNAGHRFVLDRSIAHPAALTRIMNEVAQTYPDWVPDVRTRLPELVSKEAEEHALADRIVVAGSFSRDTLIAEGIDSDRVVVNPYGVDWAAFDLVGTDRLSTISETGNRPFRFLFVGTVNTRKGIPMLLQAWSQLAARNAELWIVGRIDERIRHLIPELPGLKLFGQTSRPRLIEIYAQCDVFVLPSLFEGFGLVLLEAMAAGLPVIATPHTGAVDFVDSPDLGRIVPTGEVEALLEALRHYLVHPPSRERIQASAARLRDTYSWEAYGDRWGTLLASLD